MKIKLSPKVLKAQKEYKKNESKLYKSEAAFDRSTEKAGCIRCSVFLEKYAKVPFEKRFGDCKDCKFFDVVRKSFLDYVALLSGDDPSLTAYAKAVFEFLSDKKPDLYHKKEKKTYRWDQVFPSSFEQIEKKKYESVIALVDPELFGFYSIK